MTPWKWNDEIKLWVNSVDDETMTAIEYDGARCRQIAQLEAENAALKRENKELREFRDFVDVLVKTLPRSLVDALLTAEGSG